MTPITNKLRKIIEEQLKRDEGVKDSVYRCTGGFKTFGIGHKILPEDIESSYNVGQSVSWERIQECFNKDLDNAIQDSIYMHGAEHWEHYPDDIKAIIVNMMFNLGRTKLVKFKKHNKALQNHNWKVAAKEAKDSLWYYQTKDRAKRIVKHLEEKGKNK